MALADEAADLAAVGQRHTADGKPRRYLGNQRAKRRRRELPQLDLDARAAIAHAHEARTRDLVAFAAQRIQSVTGRCRRAGEQPPAPLGQPAVEWHAAHVSACDRELDQAWKGDMRLLCAPGAAELQ